MKHLFLIFIFLPIMALANNPVVTKELLHGAKLSERLKNGSHVLFLRHFDRFDNKEDPGNRTVTSLEGFKDCTWQNNLTDKGKKEAKAAGEAFRKFKIKLGDIVASPFCRVVESAKLFVDREPKAELNLVPRSYDKPSRDNAPFFAEQLFSPLKSTRLIVGHSNHVEWFYKASMGELLVLEPDQKTKTLKFIGAIAQDEWALAERDPQALGRKAVRSQ